MARTRMQRAVWKGWALSRLAELGNDLEECQCVWTPRGESGGGGVVVVVAG